MANRYVVTVRLLTGDARAVLATLDAGSVHCVVTSPPYYGLRDYSADGQLGLEPTPDAYVAALVDVFREVRRVLRDDGVCWLNLGDSYGKNGQQAGIPWRVAFALQADGWTLRSAVVFAKPNPMPQSVAGTRWERCRVKVANLAPDARDKRWGGASHDSRADYSGRTDGGNPHREVVWTDCPGCPKCEPNGGYVLRRGSWRPTSSHEFVFMLTKGMGYTAQQEQVRESALPESEARYDYAFGGPKNEHLKATDKPTATVGMRSPAGRNPRDVRTIATQPYSGAHFAVMPPALAEWCILAATSNHGCCSECGAQWAPVVKREQGPRQHAPGGEAEKMHAAQGAHGATSLLYTGGGMVNTVTDHRPTCDCGAPAVPCVVLDPFSGAGTTALVAAKHGRDAIGIDIKAEYNDMAEKRILAECGPMFVEVERGDA